jgi:hypothetical protein
MATPKETLEKAYGSVPKEVGLVFDLSWLPTWRGVKYVWYKKVIRKLTRRGSE